MLEFEILAQGLFRPEQVLLSYDPARQMPRTAQIEQWMEDLWQEKLAQARSKGTRLFDAPLFRLVDVRVQSDKLHILVGDTSYKEYVTTRVPEFAAHHPRHELGNALSVCSVIETSDNFILIEKRQGVDVYEGRYHVIGGFFERSLDSNASAQPDPFAAMRREIREETGIRQEDIQEQYCLGVVYDLATPHGEICFLTRLHIPLTEVQTRQPEDDEVQHLQFLRGTSEEVQAFLLANHGNISATGEPNLLLYYKEKFGTEWYEPFMEELCRRNLSQP